MKKKSFRHSGSLIVAVIFLVVAVSAVLWGSYAQKKYRAEWIPLAERMPKNVDGWESEDLPLAETEQVRNAVTEHLNYDDYIYRRYTKKGESVYVYAMFWRQGRISVREMAGHTPDGCWIANGAVRDGPSRTGALLIAEHETARGEIRSFRFPNVSDPIHVMWWHIWGGELVPASFKEKSFAIVVHEIWLWLWKRHGRPADQAFVRIHAFKPIDDHPDNPVVKKFLEVFPSVLSTASGGG